MADKEQKDIVPPPTVKGFVKSLFTRGKGPGKGMVKAEPPAGGVVTSTLKERATGKKSAMAVADEQS